MSEMITIESLYMIIGIISTVTAILSGVLYKIYKAGKSKGTEEANITNLEKKVDSLKDELKKEIEQGKKDHKEIRDKITRMDQKYDEKISALCNTVNKLSGKIEVLIQKLK